MKNRIHHLKKLYEPDPSVEMTGSESVFLFNYNSKRFVMHL